MPIQADKLWTLKSLVARRESLVKINVMLKNHLHDLLYETYPSYHRFFHDVSCQSALAFYEAYPSPSCLLRSSVEELTTLFKEASKGLIGEKKALEIWNAVEQDQVSPCEYEASRNITIRSAVSQLRVAVEGIDALERELSFFLDFFDYPLTSMKGIDTVMAAKLIAEIGNINRFRSAGALASYAGVAPVTYASGMTNIQYDSPLLERNLSIVKCLDHINSHHRVLSDNKRLRRNPT